MNYSGPEDLYRELVENTPEDREWLHGLVAFAIIEEQKIEWIRHQTENNGGEPSDEDIRGWYNQLPEGVLLRARDTAESRLTNYGQNTINTFLEDYEEEIKEEAIVKEIRSATKFRTQFGINILGGLASAILFAAILAILAFIILNNNSAIEIGESVGNKLLEQPEVIENDKREVTSKRAASSASKVLRSKGSSKAAKSAAGSALSQTRSPSKFTSKNAGAAASKTLKNKGSSKSAKTSAGSALTQRPDRKK